MEEGLGSTPASRLAPQQARFRRANEELVRRYADLAAHGAVPFICECADQRCTRVVSLTLDEYAAATETPDRFVIIPGHERDGERLVLRDERYALAERIPVDGAGGS